MVLSRLATRTAIRPVVQLTETAEHVATTRDLSRRIEAQGEDEVSRLASSFNTMLEALDDVSAPSASSSPTPRTSSGRRSPRCAPTSRCWRAAARPTPRPRGACAPTSSLQLEELTALVGDLVELARDEEPEAPSSRTCGSTAGRERGRARPPARAGHHGSRPTLEPALVAGRPGAPDRAVANLLDNAAKWSPPGGVVDVRLRDGELTVRDHGPGIDRRPTCAQVFDRFFRADSARGRPGSGLGLAIVRQVAEATAGRSPRRPPTAAARCCACGCRSSQQIPRFG